MSQKDIAVIKIVRMRNTEGQWSDLYKDICTYRKSCAKKFWKNSSKISSKI